MIKLHTQNIQENRKFGFIELKTKMDCDPFAKREQFAVSLRQTMRKKNIELRRKKFNQVLV